MAIGIVGALMLLIACVNVAVMMLARSLERRRDFAIHLAIGATRTTLARRLLAQGVGLGVTGGLAGAVIAYWGVRVLMPLMAASADPVRIPIALDLRTGAFIAVMSVGAGIVSSLVPLVLVSRAHQADDRH